MWEDWGDRRKRQNKKNFEHPSWSGAEERVSALCLELEKAVYPILTYTMELVALQVIFSSTFKQEQNFPFPTPTSSCLAANCHCWNSWHTIVSKRQCPFKKTCSFL